jgi:hypothetical protein
MDHDDDDATQDVWLAFCGVLAAGAALLASNGGAEGVGHD